MGLGTAAPASAPLAPDVASLLAPGDAEGREFGRGVRRVDHGAGAVDCIHFAPNFWKNFARIIAKSAVSSVTVNARLARCLVRGGWKPGDEVDYALATCEAFETVNVIQSVLDFLAQAGPR